MICRTCGGNVIWKGPFRDLTHTECLACGAINNQVVYDDVHSGDGEHLGECDCLEQNTNKEKQDEHAIN